MYYRAGSSDHLVMLDLVFTTGAMSINYMRATIMVAEAVAGRATTSRVGVMVMLVQQQRTVELSGQVIQDWCSALSVTKTLTAQVGCKQLGAMGRTLFLGAGVF